MRIGLRWPLAVAMTLLGMVSIAAGAVPETGPPFPGQPVPMVSTVPAQSSHTLLSCGHLRFLPSAQGTPTGAERGGDRPAHALAAYLADPQIAGQEGLPRHGWRILARGKASVEFDHDRVGQRTVDWIRVGRRRGQWSVVEDGDCLAARVLSGGLIAAPWIRKPDPHSSAGGREVEIAVPSGTCSPGNPANQPHILRIEATETSIEVRLLVVTTPDVPPPVGYACGGIGLRFFRRVVLTHALGGRALLDDSTIPGRPPVSDN